MSYKPSNSLIRVAVLQGSIDQYQKWDTAHEEFIKRRYEELVLRATTESPDLIVWPESAVPGWIPNEKPLMDWLETLIKTSGTHHIVGAVSQREGKEYNSAFFFGPDGKIIDVYDKQHLVPFGEYIPFGGFLKRWVPYLGQLGEFDAGQGPKIFKLPLKNGRVVRIAPNICYEAIFPGLIKKSVRTGADLIVNLTNDGWYLQTGAPEQHYAVNILRAVENKVPVVRAANTGISALIDPFGGEILRSELMTTNVLVGEVYSSSGSDHL